jgi:predicted nucleic acid-binding protein
MATLSKKVYLAPSAIYAFIDRANTKHAQAVAYFRFLSQQEYILYIDTVNLNEAYNLIYKKMSPGLAKDFLRIMTVSDVNVISPEDKEIKATFKTIQNYNSLTLTFSEALMAVIASRRNIMQICTFDFLHPLFGLETFFLPI